jgi:hypothetical protein
MPSKRDPSKQRRQARNRAEREALAARREAAAAPKPQPVAASTDDEPGDGGAHESSGSRASTARPPASGRATRPRAFGSSAPGTRAAFYCLVFDVFALGFSFLQTVPVDAEGNLLTRSDIDDRDRYVELRDDDDRTAAEEEELERLAPTWEGQADESRSLFLAYWPISIAFVLAAVIGVLAMIIARSPTPYRGWLRLMIVLAVLAFLTAGSFLLLPPLIALGIAQYQNRKAHLLAAGGLQPGARPASPFGRFSGLGARRDAVEVDATEVDATEVDAPDPPDTAGTDTAGGSQPPER